MAQPNQNISFYGTPETTSAPRQLSAGSVTAELDNGAIRHIKYGGIEVLRAVSFLIRNVNWGTYSPAITELEITESDGGFKVTYQARCADHDQAFTYRSTITGKADGSLSFEVEGTAETRFDTNRLGFCVLHPLVGVAGQPLRVTHTDGAVEEITFPRTIKPSQPVFDIRALAHEVCPGVTATCTLLGDTFEMEDQRNWTDASYKTYVRPLSRPYPYSVPAGETTRQSVVLTFNGQPSAGITVGGLQPVSVTVGATSDKTMPKIGLAVDQDYAALALTSASTIAATGVQLLVCQYDLRRTDTSALSVYTRLAEHLGAAVMLELIVPDDADPAAAAATAAAATRSAGLAPESVAISPAAYLMSYQPNAVWPDVPSLMAYYDAARAAFPGTTVGGGMFSYFTELNRQRPPAAAIDYVTHTTCPIVHDADDRSVMETLEALPYIVATTRDFMGDIPYRIGPSTIGMRQNPYGAAPAANPGNIRIAMAQADPRHRGLFAAAWTVGYAAEMVRGGVSVLTPAAAVGPCGIVHGGGATVPYYDEVAETDGLVYPVYQIVHGLAAAAGTTARAVEVSDRTRVQAIAFDAPHGTELWLANLYPDAVEVAVQGLEGQLTARHLDTATFVQATTDHMNFWTNMAPQSRNSVTLDGLAVARITAN